MAEDEKAVPTSGVAEMPSANSSRPSVVEDNIKDVISVRKPSREQLQSHLQATHRQPLRAKQKAGILEVWGTGKKRREGAWQKEQKE